LRDSASEAPAALNGSLNSGAIHRIELGLVSNALARMALDEKNGSYREEGPGK